MYSCIILLIVFAIQYAEVRIREIIGHYIYIYIYIHTHTYIYIFIYTCTHIPHGILYYRQTHGATESQNWRPIEKCMIFDFSKK